MTRETIINAIIGFFKENTDIFNECIEELDSYNGYLGDDRYFPMSEFDEFHYNAEPLELLHRVFYGYDEDEVIFDQWGKKHRAEFNPNRDYFRYNGCGNLVSAFEPDYSAHLDKWFIESLIENRAYLDWVIERDDELAELVDELAHCER